MMVPSCPQHHRDAVQCRLDSENSCDVVLVREGLDDALLQIPADAEAWELRQAMHRVIGGRSYEWDVDVGGTPLDDMNDDEPVPTHQIPIQATAVRRWRYVAKDLLYAEGLLENGTAQASFKRAIEGREWGVVKLFVDAELDMDGNDLRHSKPRVHQSPPRRSNRYAAAQVPLKEILNEALLGAAYLPLSTQAPIDGVCCEMVTAGADIHARDARGRTALLLAIEQRVPQACLELAELGADMHVRDKAGATALMYAARAGDAALFNGMWAWLQQIDMDAADGEGCTAAMHACKGRSVVIMQALVARGVDLSSVDREGRTVVMHAAAHGAEDVLLYLLKCANSADALGTASKSGFTPLLWGIEGGEETCVLLLQRGADPNATDVAGTTALMHAARRGYARASSLLVEGGACVARARSNGWSALFYAALNGFADVCVVLIRAGSDPNAVDHDGCTPLLYAERKGHAATCRALIAHGADRGSRHATLGCLSACDSPSAAGPEPHPCSILSESHADYTPSVPSH